MNNWVVDGRFVEKEKTECPTAESFRGLMQRLETNYDWRSRDEMMERAVLTTSEGGDGRVGQRHEPADLITVEQDHCSIQDDITVT